MRNSEPTQRSSGHPWLALTVTGAVLLALALAWRIGPLGEWASERHLAEQVSRITSGGWGPLAAIGLFALLTTLMVPHIAMVAATALALPLEVALPVSLIGSLVSASFAFALGRSRWGRVLASRFQDSPRAGRAIAALRSGGLLSIVGVRLVPVAPFTVVNLAAGIVGVSARSFLLGTVIGLAPGIALLSLAASHTLGAPGHTSRAMVSTLRDACPSTASWTGRLPAPRQFTPAARRCIE